MTSQVDKVTVVQVDERDPDEEGWPADDPIFDGWTDFSTEDETSCYRRDHRTMCWVAGTLVGPDKVERQETSSEYNF